MMNNVIGIAGPARAGKDTFAEMLVENGIDAVIVSLANPIKDMVEAGLGLSYQQLYGHSKEIIDTRYNATPRKILQTLGTEWGRELIDQDIWLNALKNKAEGNIIIPDIRFQNEADFVRKHGILIHISRDSVNINSDHASEVGVDKLAIDFFISNNQELSNLETQARSVAMYINEDWK